MEENSKWRELKKRLLRVGLIMAVLFLLVAVMQPRRFLPAGVSIGEVLEGMLGGAILGGAFAAAVFRAWQDYKNKRNKQ
jgi:hypothetical protein